MSKTNTPAQPPATKQPAATSIELVKPERIPFHPAIEQRFGIDRGTWRALVGAIFPTAKTIDGVILAMQYCKARKLDIMKRPVHIVPIYDKETRQYVETVWPGIGELRTTAFRTGVYAGKDETEFGPMIRETFTDAGDDRNAPRSIDLDFPEWARVTVYRMVHGARVRFVGPKVYWIETYATRGRSDLPNEMWQTRPIGQLDKCAEAAALRTAFPEEIGGDLIDDEAGRVTVTSTIIEPTPPATLPPSAGAAKVLDNINAKNPPAAKAATPAEPTPTPEIEGDAPADPRKKSPDTANPAGESTATPAKEDEAPPDEPAKEVDISVGEQFKAACHDAAIKYMSGEKFDNAWNVLKVKTGILAGRRATFIPERERVLKLFREQRVMPDGSIADEGTR